MLKSKIPHERIMIINQFLYNTLVILESFEGLMMAFQSSCNINYTI